MRSSLGTVYHIWWSERYCFSITELGEQAECGGVLRECRARGRGSAWAYTPRGVATAGVRRCCLSSVPVCERGGPVVGKPCETEDAGERREVAGVVCRSNCRVSSRLQWRRCGSGKGDVQSVPFLVHGILIAHGYALHRGPVH